MAEMPLVPPSAAYPDEHSPEEATVVSQPGASSQPESDAFESDDLSDEGSRRAWIETWVQSVYNSERESRFAIEARWQENKLLYENVHDFSGKDDWQSKVIISKVPVAVSTQAAVLRSGLAQTRDWFDLESTGDPMDDELLAAFKDLLIAETSTRDPNTKRDALDEWLLAFIASLPTGQLVMKVYPERRIRRVRVFRAAQAVLGGGGSEGADGLDALAALEADAGVVPEAGELVVTASMNELPEVAIVAEMVSPFDVFLDSTGRNQYRMQRISGDVDALSFLAGRPGYDEEALERVANRVSHRQSEQEEKSRTFDEQGQQGPYANRHSWEGIEFYGNVLGPDGRVLLRDAMVVVIEGELVRADASPFDDGWPLLHAPIEPSPFGEYGRPPLDNVAGLARAITELVNAVLDATLFEVLKMFEIDLEQVEDASNLATGAFPAKLWWKRDRMGSGQPMVRTVDSGQTPANVGNVVAFLDRSFQEGSNVTDLIQGLQPVRGFPSATEIATRQQNTNVAFRAVAQWLEQASLEPMLEAIFHRLVQFKLFTDEGRKWCVKVLGAERASMFYAKIASRVQADGEFTIGLDFKVTALSGMLARASELGRLAQLLDVSGRIPGLANRMNWSHLSRRVVEVLGYGADEAVLTSEELEVVKGMEQAVLQRLGQSAAIPEQLAAAATGGGPSAEIVPGAVPGRSRRR